MIDNQVLRSVEIRYGSEEKRREEKRVLKIEQILGFSIIYSKQSHFKYF
jgi:hypothetical protein